MRITSTAELGAAVRDARLRRALSQVDLASSVGTTREWIGRLENGSPRLEFDKVLSAALAVGIEILTPYERAVDADREEADQIAWDMGIEGQPLTEQGYEALLSRVVDERERREG